jgi:nicotinamidase-related amidase
MRDLGLDCFAICGIATEIGIEPTVRHATDLGYVPVIVEDACGAGDEEAAVRARVAEVRRGHHVYRRRDARRPLLPGGDGLLSLPLPATAVDHSSF